MKFIPAAILIATTLTASAAQLPTGSVSAGQSFAVREGNQFVDSTLDAYSGKILVIMLMTGWCPGCQTVGVNVGNGILDHFNANSRTASGLRGKNDRGVEINSLVLSVDLKTQWDDDIASFASLNGFQKWGLDSNRLRNNPRALLGYYRGGFPNGVNSSNLYDWGDDRRRVVVLNLVNGSPSHAYRQIILNQNDFPPINGSIMDTAAITATRAAINAIMPVPPTRNFSQWAAGYSFPAGTSGADHDADRDGSANLMEFFHGTHPVQAASRDAGPSLVRDGAALKLVYRRAKNIGGFTLEHLTSTTLAGWQVLTSAMPPTTTDLGNVEEITVTLPASSDGERFYRLAVTLSP